MVFLSYYLLQSFIYNSKFFVSNRLLLIFFVMCSYFMERTKSIIRYSFIMAYRIYTERNLADTTRDPDIMVYEELGYKFDLEEAKSVANNYIKNRFFHKDTELKKRKDGTYSATDFVSYGATVIVELITIS